MSTKFDSTYSAVVSMAEQLVGEGKYDSTYSAVLAIYQNLTSDMDTKFDSVYSIVVTIADGIESGEIDLGGGSDIELVPLNETVTYNGLHQFVPVDGVAYNQVDITVDIPNETLTQTITTNGTYDYAPSEGFFNGVSVTVDVPTGGGGSGSDDIKDYNTHKFYNMNGELVEEWTLEETQSKTELPTLGGIPFDGWTLDFDGWNWDLEQLKSASCGQNIGAMYRPSDGKTHIDIEIEPENLTYVLFVYGDYTEVDWGDGTIETVGEGNPTHTYDSEGSYIIVLNGTNIRPQWGVSPLYSQIFEGYPGWYYGSRVKTFISGVKLNSMCFGYCTNLEFLTFTGDTHVYNSAYYSFAETKSLKYLAIPKGVTNYPNPGKSIRVVSMPLGVASVSTSEYEDYNYLQSVNIPDSVTKIGDGAFYLCTSLQSINIPDGVTSIGVNAFRVCSSLQSINIPNGVTSISNNMFSGCYSLQSINIPDGVTSIGVNAFGSCYPLQSINIPSGVTSIGDSAFQRCQSLQSINIPDGVTSIGNNMFYECSSLQSVTIPDSVTIFGGGVFNSCYSLQSINIPSGVTSIGNSAFFYCSSLQSVTIPDSVTSIGQSVFGSCRSLQSVTIPDSVTSIGQSVFGSCHSLQSINIPDSVTSIGTQAFYGCKYITLDFSDNTQVPAVSTSTAIDSTALILIPESLYDEWISATNWSSLSSQIKPVAGK